MRPVERCNAYIYVTCLYHLIHIYFLFLDVYLPGDGNDGLFTTCMKDAETSEAVYDCKRGLLSNYKYVFVFGQLLHGIGASPLYTLGVSYLDDNLLPATTSLYVGVSTTYIVY